MGLTVLERSDLNSLVSTVRALLPICCFGLLLTALAALVFVTALLIGYDLLYCTIGGRGATMRFFVLLPLRSYFVFFGWTTICDF